MCTLPRMGPFLRSTKLIRSRIESEASSGVDIRKPNRSVDRQGSERYAYTRDFVSPGLSKLVPTTGIEPVTRPSEGRMISISPRGGGAHYNLRIHTLIKPKHRQDRPPSTSLRDLTFRFARSSAAKKREASDDRWTPPKVGHARDS